MSENPVAGLDPHVVQSALRAGVSPAQLEELGRMLHGKRPDLADVSWSSALRRPAKLDVLGESDEEGEAQSEAAPGVALTPEELANPVHASLQKLTSILETSTSPSKKTRSLQDTLDDSMGHAEVSSSSSLSTHNRQHAAVLQTLQKAMRDCPEEVYAVLENRMLQDCGAPEVGPGLGVLSATFRGWAEHRCRVPNIQGAVRTLWAICGALDALQNNRVNEAKARLALLIAAVDQVSFDKGLWVLWVRKFFLEDGPPFGSFSKHVAPEIYEVHHSRLLPAPWAEAMMFRIRELDDFAEKRAREAIKPVRSSAFDCPTKGREAQSKSEKEGETGRRSAGGRNKSSCVNSLTNPKSPEPAEKQAHNPLHDDRADDARRVPGAGATTVSSVHWLNSSFRVLQKLGGTFSSFLHSFLWGSATSSELKGTAKMWPMPLRFPSALLETDLEPKTIELCNGG